MAFIDNQEEEDSERVDQQITFLYKITAGEAQRSYGLNVAKLAGVPSSIISQAASHSALLEESVQERSTQASNAVFRRVASLISKEGGQKEEMDGSGEALEQQWKACWELCEL